MSWIDCWAVIFSSESSGEDREYQRAAKRMEATVQEIPGFLGSESYREGSRGITISYWKSLDAIRRWRTHPAHMEVQARGRAQWYRRYTIRVTQIVRESSFEAESDIAPDSLDGFSVSSIPVPPK